MVPWMYTVEMYQRVRPVVTVEGMRIRETARTFGLHRDTVRKMLAYSVLQGYRRQTSARRPNPSTSSGGGLHRRHRPDSGKGSQRPQEAVPHRQAYLRATQGRVRVWRRIHHGQGLREGAPPPVAGVVRAFRPPARPCPVRLRRFAVVGERELQGSHVGFDTRGFVGDPHSEPASVSVVITVLGYADRVIAFAPIIGPPDAGKGTTKIAGFTPSAAGDPCGCRRVLCIPSVEKHSLPLRSVGARLIHVGTYSKAEKYTFHVAALEFDLYQGMERRMLAC